MTSRIENIQLTLRNIYYLLDETDFMNQITDLIATQRKGTTGGDFNLVLNPNLDSTTGLKHQSLSPVTPSYKMKALKNW